MAYDITGVFVLTCRFCALKNDRMSVFLFSAVFADLAGWQISTQPGSMQVIYINIREAMLINLNKANIYLILNFRNIRTHYFAAIISTLVISAFNYIIQTSALTLIWILGTILCFSRVGFFFMHVPYFLADVLKQPLQVFVTHQT